MKLQIDGQTIRLRLSEVELQALLDSGQVERRINCPNGLIAVRQLTLVESDVDSRVSGDLMALNIDLPRMRFAEFAAERPRRDGFGFICGGLEVNVEVDVRDSRKLMQVKPRRETPTD